MTIQSYEAALKRLEKIVEELEAGDLPLEKSIKKFEEGMTLSKYCGKKLEESEATVTRLFKNSDGNLMETPFMNETEDDETV